MDLDASDQRPAEWPPPVGVALLSILLFFLSCFSSSSPAPVPSMIANFLLAQLLAAFTSAVLY